jgi:hypothetical protein
MAPDGYERLVLAVNGQFPGPTLYASKFSLAYHDIVLTCIGWGDTLSVTVVNKMQDNG